MHGSRIASVAFILIISPVVPVALAVACSRNVLRYMKLDPRLGQALAGPHANMQQESPALLTFALDPASPSSPTALDGENTTI